MPFPDPATGQVTTPLAVVIIVVATGGAGATDQQLAITGVVMLAVATLAVLLRALFGNPVRH